jgi:alanyl-tRNA synthetase
MTEKLYYTDAYIKEFSATVLSCEKSEDGYAVVLDKTAFFPEEGGQYSDRGKIGDATVNNAIEKGGVIYHFTDTPIAVGDKVGCVIDFDERYEKMQCHSGEHILSGLFHSMYGAENSGFHLGGDEVTMDINIPLSREDVERVEQLANEIIYKNVEIVARFPDEAELERMQYRSKLDLKENVRIVEIGEYDSCACCAPHVKATGEIGLIKILDFVKFRGGLRLHIAAGRRAMRIFNESYNSVLSVSAQLSVPKNEISEGVTRILNDNQELRGAYAAFKISIMKKEAAALPKTEGNAVIVFDEAEADELIAFSNEAVCKVSGILVLLSGSDGDYKYVISSDTVDLRSCIKDINKSLLGRGGGKANMVQGRFCASLAEIKEYFTP